MQATFAYLVAALAFLTAELLLLGGALLLALIPNLRRRARWVALGVPGSIIGVFASQLAALPIVFAALWTFLVPVAYFHGAGQTTSLLVIAISLAAVLVTFALFAAVSIAGFQVGWTAANALAERTALGTFLASSRAWHFLSAAACRPYRLPVLIWLAAAWSAFGLMAMRGWLDP